MRADLKKCADLNLKRIRQLGKVCLLSKVRGLRWLEKGCSSWYETVRRLQNVRSLPKVHEHVTVLFFHVSPANPTKVSSVKSSAESYCTHSCLSVQTSRSQVVSVPPSSTPGPQPRPPALASQQFSQNKTPGPMAGTCDHPCRYRLQWFRTVTARCTYSWGPLGCWTLMLTCTPKSQKRTIDLWSQRWWEMAWSRTPIHQEVNGPIDGEQWSQHISKYQHQYFFSFFLGVNPLMCWPVDLSRSISTVDSIPPTEEYCQYW